MPLSRVAFLAAVAAAAGGIALAGIRELAQHPEISLRHLVKLSSAAALHALLFGLVWRMSSRRVRSAALYLAASAAALLAAAGPRLAAAAGVLLVAAALLARVGDRIARRLLPEESRSAGVNIGFGIAAASVAGSLLASFGAFRPWAVAALAALAVAASLPGAGTSIRALRARFAILEREADGWMAAGCEILFLFAVLRFVRGLAPESGADAITRYLPYVKLVGHFHRLPEIPWQFPFILPQAGLTYAAFFDFLPVAQRGAFLLAFAGTAALTFRRCRAGRGLALVTVLILASCPVVATAAHGLQPDAFGWLVLLVLAVTATDGSSPGTARFGAACGALAALCWCSKYSTLGFAAPLGIWALGRSRRAAGWAGVGRTSAGALAAAAVAGGPWLVHTWRLARNPFFPILSSLFPSPLWRMRIDRVWGGGFAFERGWRGALLWPIDMTFHTNRYIESAPGGLGLALLVFLAFTAVSFPLLDRTERIWLVAAGSGTALMWTQTPYIRYWVPALWLAVPAVAAGARRLSESRVGRTAVAGALLAIAAGQVGLGAFHSRSALEGRAWRIFLGRTPEAEALAKLPGVSALARLRQIDPSWPKIWWTQVPSVGHADVVPLMAEPWELSFHVPPKDREATYRYIDSAGCRYWIVRNDLRHPDYFSQMGIPQRYWNPADIVLRDELVTIYRMPAALPPAS